MTGIQPELWVDRAAAAVRFYVAAFGARVLHQVGEGDEIVAQLGVGDAAFWVSPGGADGPRFSPGAISGATGRTLLLVDDPDAMFARAVESGATPAAAMVDEQAGVWDGSSIRSVMSGKSASRWVYGRQPDGPPYGVRACEAKGGSHWL